MAQQTAVKWLENKFQKFLSYYEGNHKAEPYTIEELSNDFEQAKQMEREQHESTCVEVIERILDELEKGEKTNSQDVFNQYYNETYGKE